MSMVGTIIYYPENRRATPEPIAPTLTSISQLLYGQSAAGGTDVIQHMLKCNDYTNCDVVTLNTGTPTRPSRQGEAMMRSIADKIATRTAIPTIRPRSASGTRPPSRSTRCCPSAPASRIGLSDSLIAQYRDVIAADYAYVFLNATCVWAWPPWTRTTRCSRASATRPTRSASAPSDARCCNCRRKRTCCTRRSGSFRAVSSHLEQLERHCAPACRST